MYKCPDCKSDEIEVSIIAWARLKQSEGNLETDIDEAEDRTHEWTAESMMRCQDCGHQGIANGFESDEDIDRDEVLDGGATGGVVSDCRFLRIGYVSNDDVSTDEDEDRG